MSRNYITLPSVLKTFRLSALPFALHILLLLASAPAQAATFTLQIDPAITSAKFFALVRTNSVLLSGTNSIAGSARVVVNGDDANLDPVQGTWSKTQPLIPGMNRLFIAALDTNGLILAATNRDIVAELSSRTIGGALTGSSTWTNGIIHLTNTVSIPSGQTLSIQAGAVVLLPAGVSIQAGSSSSLVATGAVDMPIYFLPEDGASEWGELSASGSGASLLLRRVETVAGRTRVSSSATGTIEDSYFHENFSGSSILSSGGAAFITVRRIHVKNYFDVNFNSSLLLAEDSLFEDVHQASGDAFEMSDAPPGLIARRMTVRRILGSNADSIDFNGARGVLVESCLLHDIADKGISIGAACDGCASSYGMTISNCLIYNANIGSAVKDGSTASFFNNTIVNCGTGLSLYKKYSTSTGGGHITNGFNNIVWANTVNLNLANGATASLIYSDIGLPSVYPGDGNINADPSFTNGSPNFRLAAFSPCAGTGLGDVDMGAILPVGGLPGAPFNLAARVSGTNPVVLVWVDDADNESGFLIERSTNALAWEPVALQQPNLTNYTDLSALRGQKYYYRVCATNFSGNSHWSNLASALRTAPPQFDLIRRFGVNYVVLKFVADSNLTYSILYRDSLADGVAWQKLSDVIDASGPVTVSDTLADGPRFYRLVTPKQ